MAPPFTARWLEIAREHDNDLPEDHQRQIDARVTELCNRPLGPAGGYHPRRDQWTIAYGDGAGLIVYAIAPAQRRVLILRIV